MSRKGEQRREQLLESARDVFAGKGYHSATVDDIVTRIEVARGTFYLYFPDKRAVLEALVDAFFERISDSLERIDLDAGAPPIEQLRGNVQRVAELALNDPATMKILLHDAVGLDREFSAKMSAFYGRVKTLLMAAFRDGEARGIVRPVDHELMAALGVGMIKEVLLESATGQLRRDANAIAEQVVNLVTGGLILPRP